MLLTWCERFFIYPFPFSCSSGMLRVGVSLREHSDVDIWVFLFRLTDFVPRILTWSRSCVLFFKFFFFKTAILPPCFHEFHLFVLFPPLVRFSVLRSSDFLNELIGNKRSFLTTFWWADNSTFSVTKLRVLVYRCVLRVFNTQHWYFLIFWANVLHCANEAEDIIAWFIAFCLPSSKIKTATTFKSNKSMCFGLRRLGLFR